MNKALYKTIIHVRMQIGKNNCDRVFIQTIILSNYLKNAYKKVIFEIIWYIRVLIQIIFMN